MIICLPSGDGVVVMKDWLDAQYDKLNHRRFVHPDPLECLYRYDNQADREIVALIAASLAYGQVRQILKSVSDVLTRMGASPYTYLMNESAGRIQQDMSGFVYRFARDCHITALLSAIQKILGKHGSLNRCFQACVAEGDPTVFPALCRFSGEMYEASGSGEAGHLLVCPEKGSACKRMNLFLRWMVRKDRVDPGGWDGISPSMLIIPLDTHMFRICRKLGLTDRKQANMKTAIEITGAFRRCSPNDPVKYDFALTRYGIRKELSPDAGQDFS